MCGSHDTKFQQKADKNLRDRVVSGEAKPAEHNGDIRSGALTKHGAILAAKIVWFLLKVREALIKSERADWRAGFSADEA